MSYYQRNDLEYKSRELDHINASGGSGTKVEEFAKKIQSLTEERDTSIARVSFDNPCHFFSEFFLPYRYKS